MATNLKASNFKESRQADRKSPETHPESPATGGGTAQGKSAADGKLQTKKRPAEKPQTEKRKEAGKMK